MKLIVLQALSGSNRVINPAAIVEVVPNGEDKLSLYMSNSCLAHGDAFRITLDELTAIAQGSATIIDMTTHGRAMHVAWVEFITFLAGIEVSDAV